MFSLIFFPIVIFSVLNGVFIRAFTRTTGLRVQPAKVLAYYICGSALTLAVYLVLTVFDELFGGWYNSLRAFFSPVLEDVLKILLLSFMASRVRIAGDNVQVYRQNLLSGIFLGLAFGLVETYLFSFVRTGSTPLLLGSMPLQMVIGGGIGASLSVKFRKLMFVAIILGHLLYNQSLNLPLANLALIVLCLASLVLLNQLTKPRDPSLDT